jgi:hypothetical protein
LASAKSSDIPILSRIAVLLLLWVHLSAGSCSFLSAERR